LAALAAAAAEVGGSMLNLPYFISALGGGVTCFSLRLAAMRWGWRLPTAREAASAQGPDEKP
jgi:uncharacterized membrane protein YeiH